jgi:hypothetical protein
VLERYHPEMQFGVVNRKTFPHTTYTIAILNVVSQPKERIAMLTNGKIAITKFSSQDGNPFKALANEVNRADAARADGLARTRAARNANAKRRAKRDGKVGA